MQNLLMLDSGAFSVANSGATIDINSYVEFCRNNPDVNYYVNLDVIPKGRDTKSLEESCRQGFRNYLSMVEELPQDKVIPVYHYGEDISWLEKYLDVGATYIGFGQVGSGGVAPTTHHLERIKPYVFHKNGERKVKTHSFAETSFRRMVLGRWYSVDSASWVKQAAYGGVWIPMTGAGGEYRYDVRPRIINVSPKSPSRNQKDVHFDSLSPTMKQLVTDYLHSIRVPLGTYEVLQVPSGYKLKKGSELWFDKKKEQVVRNLTRGVMTSHQERFKVNALFMRRANKALPQVDHIYLAGAVGSVDESVEYKLRKRLVSYAELCSGKETGGVSQVFRGWCNLVRGADCVGT